MSNVQRPPLLETPKMWFKAAVFLTLSETYNFNISEVEIFMFDKQSWHSYIYEGLQIAVVGPEVVPILVCWAQMDYRHKVWKNLENKSPRNQKQVWT